MRLRCGGFGDTLFISGLAPGASGELALLGHDGKNRITKDIELNGSS
jgi:hypothetical protein